MEQSEKFEILVKPLRRRWYILFIYICYTCINCFQWIEYSIISNIVMRYYKVSSSDVDWTGVLFMIVWPLFVFPSSFLIDKLGLRFAAISGSLLTTIGTIIKLFSIDQDRFWVVLIGQAVVALAQVFTLSLPPKLAVTWFKPSEISTVCSFGVFGMQLGSALGFLLPPIIVKNQENLEQIGHDLRILCWTLSVAVSPIALAVLAYFPHEPTYAPSIAQAKLRRNIQKVNFFTYLNSLKLLITNVPFLMHTLGFSLSYGLFSSFGTLLNQFILPYFPGKEEQVGEMGLLMIAVGMIGCTLMGFLLDKTHKEISVYTYLLSTISITILMGILEVKSMYGVYVSIAIFGFFLNGYIPAGIEFAAELNYPSNESTTLSVMTAASQIFGTILTFVLSFVTQKFGVPWAFVLQIGTLGIGTILTLFLPNKLLRQKAFESAKTVDVPVLEGLIEHR